MLANLRKNEGRNAFIQAWLPQMTNDFNNSFNLLDIIVKEYVFQNNET